MWHINGITLKLNKSRTVLKFLGQSSYYARWTPITTHILSVMIFVWHDLHQYNILHVSYRIIHQGEVTVSVSTGNVGTTLMQIRYDQTYVSDKKKVILIVTSPCTISFISNFFVCSCLTHFVTYNEHLTVATVCHKTIHTSHKLHVVRTLPSSPFNIHLVIKSSTVPTNLAMRWNMIIQINFSLLQRTYVTFFRLHRKEFTNLHISCKTTFELKHCIQYIWQYSTLVT
jgi:hypothetical protein